MHCTYGMVLLLPARTDRWSPLAFPPSSSPLVLAVETADQSICSQAGLKLSPWENGQIITSSTEVGGKEKKDQEMLCKIGGWKFVVECTMKWRKNKKGRRERLTEFLDFSLY